MGDVLDIGQPPAGRGQIQRETLLLSEEEDDPERFRTGAPPISLCRERVYGVASRFA
ncbi:hypothetical protein ACWDOR_46135 [Streptosporangium canum]|uniref:hypothetical protein n=1 Tax=Streptosporangium canum TaxID=324952 RepID=UPI00369D654A